MGEKSDMDVDKKKLYSIISTQQKTIENQQKTIDRLTAKLVQELPEDPLKKWQVSDNKTVSKRIIYE